MHRRPVSIDRPTSFGISEFLQTIEQGKVMFRELLTIASYPRRLSANRNSQLYTAMVLAALSVQSGFNLVPPALAQVQPPVAESPQTTSTAEAAEAIATADTDAGIGSGGETALMTVAEASRYRATATATEVEVFLRRLTALWPAAELTTIGETNESRPIWAVVIEPQTAGEVDSTDASASQAATTVEHGLERPLTVLVLGGIHSGECDGKEAILALARDMAQGKQGDWWHSLRLIFVPNFSADSNQRRSPDHRPGQAGPSDGMGVRPNAQGLDLNRDFVKLESPEVRSLVTAINRYDVDVLIDMHTTNGSLHQYHLTYDIPHNPTAPPSIDRWLRDEMLPQVTEEMLDAGFQTFYYGNFSADHKRWETYGHEPRYSTEYMGLRGKIGILSESYSYEDYFTRIEASYAFMREVLQCLADNQLKVRALIDAASLRTLSPMDVPVQAELALTDPAIRLLGYQRADGSPPRGPYGPNSEEEHEKKTYTVQFSNRTEVTRSVPMPAGYAIPQQYAWAASRLAHHGVRLQQVSAETTLPAETYTVEQVERGREFQGHEMLAMVTSVDAGTAKLPVGTFIVDTAQPLGMLAAYILEPMSDESLAKWNFFDPDVQVGEAFPVQRLAKLPAVESLKEVAEVAAAEPITLEHLFDAERQVDYTMSPLVRPRWLPNPSEKAAPAEYLVGEGVAVEAESGAERRLRAPAELARALSGLEAFTRERAQATAKLERFSDDLRHALIDHQNDLYYFDAEAGVVRQLTHSPQADERLAELSPDGRRVAFVRDNDLWLVDCQTTEERRLTEGGSPELLNGILDWVYQEELYGRGNFKAFWWSPDGSQIALLQLDQTPVPRYQVSDSISFGQTLEETRYPKAGEPLPTAEVLIVSVDEREMRTVDLSKWPADDRLVVRVSWSPAGELWLQVMNRVQNHQDLVRVDPTTGQGRVVLSESSPGWLRVRGTPEFLRDGTFLWLSDVPDGRTHLFHVSQDGMRTQLTRGDWDVHELLSVSADERQAFVHGNLTSPIEQQLIGVDLQQARFYPLTSGSGTHSASVDPTGRYFIDTYSSNDSPPRVSLHSIDGQFMRLLDIPQSDRFKFWNVQQPIFTTIRTRDGVDLQAAVMLPPGIDTAQPTERLPVVFHVYGGPRSPTVKDAWSGRNYWWHQMLCQRGYAVVLCDNRSALGRGVKDTWTIRGDLGRVEMQDLDDAVAWVKQQAWADPDRLGIWGWSYGGYFSAYAMTHSDHFRAGIAGAPVTDWRNYDAIYTERYMDLPRNNEAGYKSSSVVEAADQLSGRLMIIHGERDDNVHMSNTLQLAHALQQAGKQFDLMIYPKNRHGIVAPKQREHLYRMMTEYFERYLR